MARTSRTCILSSLEIDDPLDPLYVCDHLPWPAPHPFHMWRNSNPKSNSSDKIGQRQLLHSEIHIRKIDTHKNCACSNCLWCNWWRPIFVSLWLLHQEWAGSIDQLAHRFDHPQIFSKCTAVNSLPSLEKIARNTPTDSKYDIWLCHCYQSHLPHQAAPCLGQQDQSIDLLACMYCGTNNMCPWCDWESSEPDSRLDRQYIAAMLQPVSKQPISQMSPWCIANENKRKGYEKLCGCHAHKSNKMCSKLPNRYYAHMKCKIVDAHWFRANKVSQTSKNVHVLMKPNQRMHVWKHRFCLLQKLNFTNVCRWNSKRHSQNSQQTKAYKINWNEGITEKQIRFRLFWEIRT